MWETRPPVVQTSTVVNSIDASTSQCALINVLQIVRRRRFGAGSMPCSFRRLPISNRLARDMVAQVGQRSLNPVVAPGRILAREAKYKTDDLLPHAGTSRRVAATGELEPGDGGRAARPGGGGSVGRGGWGCGGFRRRLCGRRGSCNWSGARRRLGLRRRRGG